MDDEIRRNSVEGQPLRGAVLRVEEADRADALLDARTLRFLAQFARAEASADAAARELGVNHSTLAYRVARLLESGLLVPAGTGPSRARRVRLYRTAADVFFVPFGATRLAEPVDVLLREYGPVQRAIFRNFLEAGFAFVGLDAARDFGFVVALGPGGDMVARHGPDPSSRWSADTSAPDAPALHAGWGELRLDFADAKALQREMTELFARYSRRRGGGTYL